MQEGGDDVMGAEEEQFQGGGRHDSFDPPEYNQQKWEDEEEDWEAEQRERDDGGCGYGCGLWQGKIVVHVGLLLYMCMCIRRC